jgi:hypothetical protein
MVNQVVYKDPDETRVEPMDWTDQLNSGATISTSAWTFPAGLTKVTDGIVTGNKKTFVKMSGGTADTDYVVTNTIVTSDGETLEESATVRVKGSS